MENIIAKIKEKYDDSEELVRMIPRMKPNCIKKLRENFDSLSANTYTVRQFMNNLRAADLLHFFPTLSNGVLTVGTGTYIGQRKRDLPYPSTDWHGNEIAPSILNRIHLKADANNDLVKFACVVIAATEADAGMPSLMCAHSPLFPKAAGVNPLIYNAIGYGAPNRDEAEFFAVEATRADKTGITCRVHLSKDYVSVSRSSVGFFMKASPNPDDNALYVLMLLCLMGVRPTESGFVVSRSHSIGPKMNRASTPILLCRQIVQYYSPNGGEWVSGFILQKMQHTLPRDGSAASTNFFNFLKRSKWVLREGVNMPPNLAADIVSLANRRLGHFKSLAEVLAYYA